MSEERWADRLDILRTVGAAALLAFLVEVAIRRPTLGAILASAAGYAILLVLYFFFGRWLGRKTWPRRGHKLAKRLLARRIKKNKSMMFLSDRPDRAHTTPQRVWEVVGFSAGVTVLVVTILILVQSPLVGVAGAVLPAVTLWGSFILVPYWLFSRLGVRIVDAVRWLILPLSNRYADRWKLSNGTFVLLALGATVNTAIREGADGAGAVVSALVAVLRVVASVLVIAATAVAYYQREERRVAHELENEAIIMGIRDGRGMSDGDFLPRLPPPKA